MREPHGVLWLNGPFGGGKSSVARRLVEGHAGSVLFDPEVLGAMLKEILESPRGDFQDLPQWRELLVETVAILYRHDTNLIVMPMTVLRVGYLEQLLTGLRATGAPIWHVLLDTSQTELERRIATDMEETGAARAWRRARLQDFMKARAEILPFISAVVSTEGASVDFVAERISNWLEGASAESSGPLTKII